MAQAMTSAAKDAVMPVGEPSSQLTADQVPYELSPDKMMMDNFFLLAMVLFIFYFILIRPQQKRLKIQRDVMKSLQKGNKVMTSGGIIGTINKLDGDDVVVLEIAQGIKIRMAKSAIVEVVADKSPGESANDN